MTTVGRRAAWTFVAGFVGALVLTGLRLAVVEPPPGDAPRCDRVFVSAYDPPRTKAETIIDSGDAQAWAAMALDPTFSHPERYCDGTPEFVYRSQRPLFGWLVWAGGLGQAGLVPASLFVLTAAGIGLLGAASVLLADQQGLDPRFAPATLLLPGVVLTVIIPGPEALATALVMLGIRWWYGPPRRWVAAVAVLAAATLIREVLLVVPVVIAVHELVRRHRSVRQVLPLALALVPYPVWVGVLAARYGRLPVWENPYQERIAAPFAGLARALGAGDALALGSLVLAVVIVTVDLVRARHSVLTWCVVAMAALMVVLGASVWKGEMFRVMLPMYALGLVALLRPRSVRARPTPAG